MKKKYILLVLLKKRNIKCKNGKYISFLFDNNKMSLIIDI